ncbi:MAG: MFS transporter [Chlorobi bacterium]|nr:MFS transporter [Chlorobiota bacterium]
MSNRDRQIGFEKNKQYYKFCAYGFLKNLRFFEPFFILYLASKGLTFLEIGFLYSIREIGTNLLEIPTGIISDSVGRRRTMIAAFAVYIISFGIFHFFSGFAVFSIAMIFFSVGDAFRSGTHKAMIFEYLRLNNILDQKVHYYGHTRSYSQAGSALSALAAGAMVYYGGNYEMIFLLSIIPNIIDMLLMISYPKELDGEINRGDRLLRSELGTKKKILATLADFRTALSSMKTIRALLNMSVHSAFYKAGKDYLQPILKAAAISIPVLTYVDPTRRSGVIIGLVYFLIFMMNSSASRNSGKFVAKFSSLSVPLNLTVIISFAFAAIAGLFFTADFGIIGTVMFILVFIIENLRKPVAVAFVSESLNPKVLASVLSAASQLKSLLAALAAPAIGLLSDIYGIGTAITTVALVFLLLYPLYKVSENPK